MFQYDYNLFSLRYSIKKGKLNNMQFFWLTSAFDLDVKLTGKGQHFNLKWFDGPTMQGLKVVFLTILIFEIQGQLLLEGGLGPSQYD